MERGWRIEEVYLEVCFEKKVRGVVETPFARFLHRRSGRGRKVSITFDSIDWPMETTYLSLIHNVNTRLITLAASSNLSFFSNAPLVTSSPIPSASMLAVPLPTLVACSSSAFIAKTLKYFPAVYKTGSVHAAKPVEPLYPLITRFMNSFQAS